MDQVQHRLFRIGYLQPVQGEVTNDTPFQDERTVTSEFFTHLNGYKKDEVQAIASLSLGQLWQSTGLRISKAVKRVK